jgi:hypothetical protein
MSDQIRCQEQWHCKLRKCGVFVDSVNKSEKTYLGIVYVFPSYLKTKTNNSRQYCTVYSALNRSYPLGSAAESNP